MKISGGHWLLLVSAIYLELGLVDMFVYKFAPVDVLPMFYVLAISLPLYIPPLARFFNVKCIWEA